MNYKEFFKTHPYLIKQVGITALSIFAVAVTLIEKRFEAEHKKIGVRTL